MLKRLDNWLSGITMYRLVLGCLMVWWGWALILSFFGWLAFGPWVLIGSGLWLAAVGLGSNWLFARVFGARANWDSAYISLLILALIVRPAGSLTQLGFLFWAAVWTMAGKYIFASQKRHWFNPVALAVVLTDLFLAQSASWWVATAWMLGPVIVGGWLIVRKIRREAMVGAFLLAAALMTLALNWSRGPDLLTLIRQMVVDSPLIFFGLVMLTEPLTTPPTRPKRLAYGLLVGALFPPQLNLAGWHLTPEMALIIGNLYSYAVSFKPRLILTLKEKVFLTDDITDFIFSSDRQFNFPPGQYLELNLPHRPADSRGSRRYFTLASSPTETNLRFGVKFYPRSSSFKSSLKQLAPGQTISATALAGDFTLPPKAGGKLAFIAGGIGVTPFRSILKYLVDKGQRRDIVLFYINHSAAEAVYQDIFSRAQARFGLRLVPFNTATGGHLTAAAISQVLLDYKERTFYISGPHRLVTSCRQLLLSLALPSGQIVTDYFPGF